MTTHKDSGGEGVAMRFSKARCFGLMQDALQAPVHLECGPDVERIRQGFYRARRYCQARSIYRYDALRFHVRGPTLVIRKRSVPAARVEVLQELCECVAPVDCPGGSGRQKAREFPQ